METKFWYSRREAANLLSISIREIDRLISNGTIRTHYHGRRRLVIGSSLTQFVRSVDQSPKPSAKGDGE
jgi:excisionase family DNA binding protein